MKTAQDAINDIKQKVESAGFRMADLCRVAGISQAQLSRWQNGITEPLYINMNKLEQAAQALIEARLRVLNKAMEDAVK
jgi:transcriptional regulator with XRE-family HTH domain